MKKFFIILATAFVVFSCRNDETTEENNFEGKDAYLVDFSLITNGQGTYQEVIIENNLTMYIPGNVSLENVVAEFSISENASIYPNPASITDWTTSQQFRVTAFNGSENIYNYSVNYLETAYGGDLVLATQSEVDEFGSLGMTLIAGNVTIGNGETDDPVTSLLPLQDLKEIKYYLKINSGFEGVDLEGLHNIETIGGILMGSISSGIYSSVDCPYLTDINFPSLVKIGMEASIISDIVDKISFPSLETVSGNLTLVSSSFKEVDLGSLTNIGGSLNILGSLTVVPGGGLESVIVPLLHSANGLNISYHSVMENFSVPSLQTVEGDVQFFQNEQLSILNLPNLNYINGKLSLNRVAISDLDSFTNFETINGELILSSFNATELKVPIKRMNGLTVDVNSNIEVIDISESDLMGSIMNVYARNLKVIKGPDEFNGSIVYYGKPELIGFGTIDNITVANGTANMREPEDKAFTIRANDVRIIKGDLHITVPQNNSAGYYGDIIFKNLEEIGGTFTLSRLWATGKLSMPVLRTIGMRLYFNQSFYLTDIELPSLQNIGLELYTSATRMDINIGNVLNFNLPELNIVDGDINILVYSVTGGTESIQMSNLAEAGNITLGSTSSAYVNRTLTDLDFSSLINAASVKIYNFTSLRNFSTFANVIPVLSPDTWIVSGCGSNPDYTEMEEYCFQF